jgi:hypothetical protein
LAQQKTVKQCQDEWRANKQANQAAKITEKAYVEKCRADSAKPAAATTAPAPAAAPAPAPAAAPARPAATTPMAPAPRQTAAAPTSSNQFTTEAQAKGRCPTDTVVYVNLKSKIYHFSGHKDYGNLKNGAFMCEKDTAAVGARASKSEKHP